MKGCGLVVVNPPWGFAEEVQAVLPVLANIMAIDGGATSRWAWLVPER